MEEKLTVKGLEGDCHLMHIFYSIYQYRGFRKKLQESKKPSEVL